MPIWPLIQNPNFWRQFFTEIGGQTGTLTGVVFSSGNTPLGGAPVGVFPGGPSTVTRSDGTFSIYNVPVGTFSVYAKYGSLEALESTTLTADGSAFVVISFGDDPDFLPSGYLVRYLASEASSVTNEDGLSVLDGTATALPSISNPALAGTARVKTWVNQANPGTNNLVFAVNTQVPTNFAKGWAYYQTDLGSPALHWKPVWDTRGDVSGEDVNVMSNLTAGTIFIVARAEQIHDRLGSTINGGDPLCVQTYGGYSGLVQSYLTGATPAVTFFTIDQSNVTTTLATTTDTQNYHLWTIVKGASTWEVRLDGVSLGTVPRPSTSGTRTLAFGEPASALYTFMKEFVYYDSALSASSLAIAEQYFLQRYEI